MVDFFANGLCYYCNSVKNELMELAAFNDVSESSWKDESDKLNNKLSEMLKRHPRDAAEDIVDGYSWDMYLNQSKYPSLHREALIITLFNFLEHKLNSLCCIFYDSIDSDLKLKDIHGKGFERAVLFLKKVVNIDFSSFGAEFPFIKRVNLIRNIIVHNGGVLPNDSNHEANKFVSSAKYISGSAGGEINISPEFIGHFIDILVAFFDKLDHEIHKYIEAYNS